MYTQKKSF